MMVEKRLTSHHKSGSTETALLRVVVNKGLLDRMELSILRQAFNRGDLMGLCVNGQHRAGINRFAVQMHRTCAAGATVAHALGAGQVELVAQSVEQCDPRFE